MTRTDVAADAIRMANLQDDLRAGQPLVEREYAVLLKISVSKAAAAEKALHDHIMRFLSKFPGSEADTKPSVDR